MKHGQRYTKIYKAWVNMKQRCSNPNRADELKLPYRALFNRIYQHNFYQHNWDVERAFTEPIRPRSS